MSAVLDAVKFLLGGVILMVSLFDDNTNPVVTLIALLLMGVVTVDQIREWMNRRAIREETP